MKHVVLWNAVISAARQFTLCAVVDGTLKPGDTELEAGRLGALRIIGSSGILRPPTISMKNINDFDF